MSLFMNGFILFLHRGHFPEKAPVFPGSDGTALPMKMKKCTTVVWALLLGLAALCPQRGTAKEPLRVLLVTGGHDFDRSGFTALMAGLPDIACEWTEHPDAFGAWEAGALERCDAILLYDMQQQMPDGAQAALLDALRGGKGLVVLHHAYCSYDRWDEYRRIVGGRYYHYEWVQHGRKRPASHYRHDVTFGVKVLDRKHPVTRGIGDFTVVDETYGGAEVLPGVHPLLGTDEPSSGPLLAWTTRYGRACVVTILLGHDAKSWELPDFRKLLSQALRWSAR